MPSLVSVVIATHNQSRYLGYTIESVLGQTYRTIEVIVVDDGSTDATPEIAARFGERIRYVRQANTERGAARNHGLKLASGEYIAFLDSDDIWLPSKLEKEVRFLERHPEVGLVYSDRDLIDADGRYIGTARAPNYNGWVTARILKDNFIGLSVNLMRRDLMVAAGGFPEDRLIAGSEDWVAWVHLSTITQFAHLAEVTVLYRIHPENTMNNAPSMERAMNNAVKAIEAADWLPAHFHRYLSRAKANRALINAINYCSAGDKSIMWRWLIEAPRHSVGVLADPRFAYTVVRSFVPGLIRAVNSKRHAWRARPPLQAGANVKGGH